MEGILILLVTVGLTGGAFPWEKAEAELSADIHVEELKAHVYRLASPEFLGRRGSGAARTARHLAVAFTRLRLEPAFGASYFQSIPARSEAGGDHKVSFIGRNVVAVLPGTDAKLKDEWILLSAHFDHLGKRDGKFFPGADDNASGVAMLLEVAEHFALTKKKPRRTLVFAAFDQEETGLHGSTYFAAHPPRLLTRLKAMLTADMLGRSMANVMDEHVFVLGSEHSPALRRVVERVTPPRGLTVGRLGADLIGTRSDYGPFRDRKVPFLFFSTGQHPDYHKPTDLPERIDYQKLQRISCWVRDLTRRLCDDEEAPAWSDRPGTPDLDEIRVVRLLLQRVLARPECCPLPPKSRALVEGAEKHLGKIVTSGRVTKEDRAWLLLMARLMMTSVF